MIKKFLQSLSIGLLIVQVVNAQPDRWQQAVDYKMDVDFNIKTHQLTGKQKLKYYNNSPDTLYKVFYHLYLNAFQPNSEMDVRSREIIDPDKRVGDRITKLKWNEQGFIKVEALKMNGKPVKYKVVGTILEVTLSKPILPRKSVVFDMDFISQLPLQIRRTGRFNAEGIEYSFAQWYPKMCNYDYQGWHAHPYVGREFYGIWGDFDVKITLPSNYIVAGTGYLQNKAEVGYGYSDKEPASRNPRMTWHFKANKVHDFVWAADPDYKQIVHKMTDGTVLRFFYQPGDKTDENWQKLPPVMEEVFNYVNNKYGKYPYKEYAFIQGGDGGMEYPMATLITGERGLVSLVGVSVHELVHSWYQMVLASNELLYPWMDEGFTSYVSDDVMNHLIMKKLIPGKYEDNPHLGSVRDYIKFSKTGYEEALSTHADHYTTNAAYNVASYVKGAVFLEQLRYIIGEDAFSKGMLVYFNTWKFKHPNPNDFIRIMEKVSGLELDWFKEYFVNTTDTIDYEIVEMRGNELIIKRIGQFPMPLDITVKLNDGTLLNYYIPLDMMRGSKKGDIVFHDFKENTPVSWVKTGFSIFINNNINDIDKVEIDASQRMADTDRNNNIWPRFMEAKEDYK
ncbi:MAG TPA: M1 family metallopeptidase [Saprospiraceae bacterium]|nr:M1 family metallopeptidase [Saprospiraceae bacterium]HRO09317.1 M1 family metallopeptidase [Saprospiraceae bacterium]HRP42554.1 M1 family metallopeptidase [Saprospiraceae bacterium]